MVEYSVSNSVFESVKAKIESEAFSFLIIFVFSRGFAEEKILFLKKSLFLSNIVGLMISVVFFIALSAASFIDFLFRFLIKLRDFELKLEVVIKGRYVFVALFLVGFFVIVTNALVYSKLL